MFYARQYSFCQFAGRIFCGLTQFYYLCTAKPFDYMTICIDGKIRTLSPAWVMGIINATPDSFYAGSRTPGKDGVAQRARRLIDLGADCLDIGGDSSRPGASHIPADEEYSRLAMALEQVRRIDESAVISVDTFRADVARR